MHLKFKKLISLGQIKLGLYFSTDHGRRRVRYTHRAAILFILISLGFIRLACNFTICSDQRLLTMNGMAMQCTYYCEG